MNAYYLTEDIPPIEMERVTMSNLDAHDAQCLYARAISDEGPLGRADRLTAIVGPEELMRGRDGLYCDPEGNVFAAIPGLGGPAPPVMFRFRFPRAVQIGDALQSTDIPTLREGQLLYSRSYGYFYCVQHVGDDASFRLRTILSLGESAQQILMEASSMQMFQLACVCDVPLLMNDYELK